MLAQARRPLLLLCIASLFVLLALHLWAGNGYGFHRDELQFLDNAHHLAAGYTAYPPLTSWATRASTALLGDTPSGMRAAAMLVNTLTLCVDLLLAAALGGTAMALGLTWLATLPIALLFSCLMQYTSFDQLSWSLLALGFAKVLQTKDQRWWIGAGVGVGIGILSKYSIAMPVAGLLCALVALPSQRHHLRSRWFWLGAATALVIALPNLAWLAQHDFVTLRMESFIHRRDVAIGRADGFFPDQLRITLFGFPLAMWGLYALLRDTRLRPLAFLYLVPLALFALARGRGYYMLPGYPVLYAAGAVAFERALRRMALPARAALYTTAAVALLAGSAAQVWTYLPVWRTGSAPWQWQMQHTYDMAEEVGWPELVAQTAAVRDALPPDEKQNYMLVANNYGEASALNLYGPAYGLPTVVSTVNSFWARGYGKPADTIILLGSSLATEHAFESCRIAAMVHIPDGVHNEESEYHPEILVCHTLRKGWTAFWPDAQTFG